MAKRILQFLGKIPAGMMLVPLFLGMLIHTFVPQALEIGSFTTALFSSQATITLTALQLLCLGSRLRVQALPRVFAKGTVLLVARSLCGLACVLLFRYVLQSDEVAGVCVLAAVCAISNTNGNVYMSLCNLLGDAEAAAGTPIVAMNNGPMLPLLLLGMTGYLTVSAMDIVAMVFPVLFGMFLGSVSEDIAKFLDGGVGFLLPFIGFSLGAGIDLQVVFTSGIGGLLLAIITLLIGGGVLWVVDRYLCKGTGAVGVAAAATGANAIYVPAMIAAADPYWQPFVASATAQIATCAVIAAIVIPVATSYLGRQTVENYQ